MFRGIADRRWLAFGVLLAALSGCGSNTTAGRVSAGTTTRGAAESQRCKPAVRGFRICYTVDRDDQIRDSGVFSHGQGGWTELAGTPGAVFDDGNWWRRVVPSPDRRTLLLEWLGPCDLHFTFLFSVRTHELTEFLLPSNSRALGWSADGQARIRLLTRFEDYRSDTHDLRRVFRPGIYTVDPVTHAITRERSSPAGSEC